MYGILRISFRLNSSRHRKLGSKIISARKQVLCKTNFIYPLANLTSPPGNLLNLRATERFVDSHIQTSTTRSLRRFSAICCLQKFVFVNCQSAYRIGKFGCQFAVAKFGSPGQQIDFQPICQICLQGWLVANLPKLPQQALKYLHHWQWLSCRL